MYTRAATASYLEQGLVNLAVPLIMFYWCPTLKVHLITHYTQTVNIKHKHTLYIGKTKNCTNTQVYIYEKINK